MNQEGGTDESSAEVGHLDGLVIRPLREGDATRKTVLRSAWVIVLATMICLVLGFLVHLDVAECIGAELMVVVIVALSSLWALQPWACLFLTAGSIGERTGIGIRHEVPLTRATAIRVNPRGSGARSPAPSVVIEGEGGRVLLRHYNAQYGPSDLQAFARRAGVKFIDGRLSNATHSVQM